MLVQVLLIISLFLYKCDNNLSSLHTSLCGLPQGSVLCPLLFLFVHYPSQYSDLMSIRLHIFLVYKKSWRLYLFIVDLWQVDFTAEEHDAIQSALRQHLGPSFISQRVGAGGQKVSVVQK